MIKRIGRRKFILLYVLAVTVLSLMVLGLGRWLIVPMTTSSPKQPSVDPGMIDTSPAFTSSVVYNGGLQEPVLNDDGKAIFGENYTRDDTGETGTGYRIEYVTGDYFLAGLGGGDNQTIIQKDDDKGIVAGYHYYKIVDNATGQIICNYHRMEIGQAELTEGKITFDVSTPKYLFAGNDIKYTASWQGQGRDGVFEFTGTTQAVSFSNSASLTYSGAKAVVSAKSSELDSSNRDLMRVNNYSNADTASATSSKYTVLATCYFYSSSATYYGTLGDALTDTASKSGTLIAMQSFTYDGTTYTANPNATANRYEHKLNGTFEVGPNVTLLLPFRPTTKFNNSEEDIKTTDQYAVDSDGDGVVDDNGYSKNEMSGENGNTSFRPTATCVNEVVLDGTLTVYGHLKIAGITGINQPGATTEYRQGMTSGKHATITMTGGSEADDGSYTNYTVLRLAKKTGSSVSPTMDIRGYITPESEYTWVDAQSGTINMPFVVYSFGGGGATVALFKGNSGELSLLSTSALNNYVKGDSFNVAPFHTFDMPNIQVELHCQYTTTINGLASLFTNGASASFITIKARYNVTSIKIFGSSNALINMTDGKAVFDYNPENVDAYRYKSDSEKYIPNVATCTKITLDGTTYSGDMSMLVSVPLMGEVAVSLTEVKFPVSQKIKLFLIGDHDYTFSTSFKFLPGSELHVDGGARLNIPANEGVMFYDKIGVFGLYSDATYPATARNTPALCQINNGTLNVLGSIGGVITTAGVNSKLNLTNAQNLTMTESEGSGSYKRPGTLSIEFTFTPHSSSPITQITQGLIVHNQTVEADSLPIGTTDNMIKTEYKGIATASDTTSWRQKALAITLDANGGTVANGSYSVNVSDSGYPITSVAIPTRDYYTFNHWCTHQSCTNGGSCTARPMSLYVGTTLYAQWTPITYTINYIYKDPSGVTVTIPDPGIPSVSYTVEDVASAEALLTLPQNPPALDTYTLAGWFDETGTPVSSGEFTFHKLTELAGSDNSVTLAGHWTNKFYNVTFDLGENPYELASITAGSFAAGYFFDGDSNIYGKVAVNDGITTNSGLNRYFAGWYVDESLTIPYTTAYMPEGDDYTLYAKWGTKATLTVNYGDNELGYTGTTVYIRPDAIYALEDLTIGDYDTAKSKYSNGWTVSDSNAISIVDNEAALACQDGAVLTVTANWLGKVKFTVSYGSVASGTSFTAIADRYFIPGTVVDISTLAAEAVKYDEDPFITKYFNEWTVSGNATISADGTEIALVGGTQVTITAEWLDKVQIVIDYNHGRFTGRSDLYFKPGTENNITEYLENVTEYDNIPTVDKYFDKYEVTAGSATIAATMLSIDDEAVGSVTVQAQWLTKTTTLVFTSTDDVNAYPELLTYGGSTLVYGTTYYFHPDMNVIPLMSLTGNDDNPEKKYYFNGWSLNSNHLANDATSITLAEGSNTFNINWSLKYTFTYSTSNSTNIYSDMIPYGTVLYYKPETAVELISPTSRDNNINEQYYFSSWTLNGTSRDNSADSFIITEDSVINITWGTKVTVRVQFWDGDLEIIVTNASGVAIDTISLADDVGTAKSYYVKPGTITAKYYNWVETDEVIFTYSTSGSDANKNSASVPNKPSDLTATPKQWVYSGAVTEGGTISFYADSNDSGTCVTSDTLITLADGSQKRVADLTGDEMLLVWNHLTGKLDIAPIAYIVDYDKVEYEQDVIRLVFSDGSYVDMINEHVFFIAGINKYVAIVDENADDFIGQSFIQLSGDGVTSVTLERVERFKKTTGAYEVVTYQHLTCFTNGILSTSAYLDPLLNVFDISGETLGYDSDKIAEDIEQYGLYTYDDFKDLITEEAFELYNAKYLKIAVGKGYIVWEDILELIDIYFDKDITPIQ